MVNTSVKSWQQKGDVRVFIPGEWVIIRHIDLPDGTVRQEDRVVPALLEEELGEDIDTLHFAVLYVEQQRAAVAVIRHQKMQWLSDWLQQTCIFPMTVLPDWMAFKSGQCIIHNNRCLMRSGQWQGWSAELSMVDSILRADEQKFREHIQLYLSAPPTSELISQFSYYHESLQVREYSEANREILFAGSLQCGRWRGRTNYRSLWRRWRSLVWVVVLVVCLLPLQRMVTLLTLEARTKVWQEMVDHMIEKETGKPASETVRARFNTFLLSLSQPRLENELLVILPQVARVLASLQQAVNITGLTFEQNEKRLSVTLRARNKADLDATLTALSAEFRVEEENVQKEAYQISTVLTISRKNDSE